MEFLGITTLAVWIKPNIYRDSINFAILFSLVGVLVLTFLKRISTYLVIYSLGLSLLEILLRLLLICHNLPFKDKTEK